MKEIKLLDELDKLFKSVEYEKKMKSAFNFLEVNFGQNFFRDTSKDAEYLKQLENEAKQNPAEVDAFEEAFQPKRELGEDCQ